MKNWWLYAILLEQDKYYVGITSKEYPNQRIKQHFSGFYGAQWTKKYKPVKTLDVINLGKVTKEDAEKIENRTVREYIEKYGLDNVRGGDIAYIDKAVARFGRIFKLDDWEGTTIVALLLLVVIYLLVDKYFF